MGTATHRVASEPLVDAGNVEDMPTRQVADILVVLELNL